MMDFKVGKGRWNYRIVRHPCGSLTLNEVHYDANGVPTAVTSDPATFACHAEEGRDGIIASLEMALKDAREKPLFVPPSHWSH